MSRAINPIFGTMEDFDSMMAEANNVFIPSATALTSNYNEFENPAILFVGRPDKLGVTSRSNMLYWLGRTL